MRTVNCVIAAPWGVSKRPTTSQFWIEFIFPSAAAWREFLSWFDRELQRAERWNNFFDMYMLPLKHVEGALHFPLSFFPSEGEPEGGYHYGVGFYYRVPLDRPAELEAAISFIREAQDTMRALGGRPYLHGWQDWDSDRFKSVYGSDWATFCALKKQVDPDLLINGDVLPFPRG